MAAWRKRAGALWLEAVFRFETLDLSFPNAAHPDLFPENSEARCARVEGVAAVGSVIFGDRKFLKL
jgi:hypothetical protein